MASALVCKYRASSLGNAYSYTKGNESKRKPLFLLFKSHFFQLSYSSANHVKLKSLSHYCWFMPSYPWVIYQLAIGCWDLVTLFQDSLGVLPSIFVPAHNHTSWSALHLQNIASLCCRWEKFYFLCPKKPYNTWKAVRLRKPLRRITTMYCTVCSKRQKDQSRLSPIICVFPYRVRFATTKQKGLPHRYRHLHTKVIVRCEATFSVHWEAFWCQRSCSFEMWKSDQHKFPCYTFPRAKDVVHHC